MHRLIFSISLILISLRIYGQDSSASSLQISGYLETYYSYDFAKPKSHLRPSFFYNYNRHNELNVNLALIKATYKNDHVRGNAGLMAGTYANYNLASEPATLKNIFEANAGIKLLTKHRLWLDAGIFPSHIGFESAIGKDCWNLTRSILADNSPYYEAGARISLLTRSEKLYLAVMYLNGWQRITKIPGNQTPSFGTQLTFTPSRNFSFNWSTYVGNERPDSLRAWRIFNNLYGQWQVNPTFGLTLGFDYGLEQSKKHSSTYNAWYSPVAIVRIKTTEKTSVSVRGEYYCDPRQVIVKTGMAKGLETFGYSANLDFRAYENCLLRLEARALSATTPIFISGTNLDDKNYFVTGSIALSF